jgi:hypothetical protein
MIAKGWNHGELARRATAILNGDACPFLGDAAFPSGIVPIECSLTNGRFPCDGCNTQRSSST